MSKEILKAAGIAAAVYGASQYMKNRQAQAAENVDTTGAWRAGGTAVAGLGGNTDDLSNIAYGDRVYVLSTAAGGVAYPAGTRRYPCATLAQARTVAALQGLNSVEILDTIPTALDADMIGWNFYGQGLFNSLLGVGGFSIDESSFWDMGLAGDAHAATVDRIYCYRCAMLLTTNPIDLFAIDCYFENGYTTFIDEFLYAKNCNSGNILGHIFDFTAMSITGNPDIIDWQGGIVEYDNLTTAVTGNITGCGTVNFDVSCTLGTITIRGDMRITGAAGGITITDQTSWSILVALLAGMTRTRCGHMTQAGALTEEVQFFDAATDVALPQIVVADIPAGATVTHAHLIWRFGACENTAIIENGFDGAVHVQISKGGGAWQDAAHIPDHWLTTPPTSVHGGETLIGDIDIGAVVTGNDTYTFQVDNANMHADFMLMNDVQMQLYIEWSI